MKEQEPHSDGIPSPGGGETPHPRTGPDQGGSQIDIVVENKQAEERNKDSIKETEKQAADSDVKHLEGDGAGQSLTAGDQKSGQAPAASEQGPSGTVPDHADREAMKLQEPMDNSVVPAVEDPATGNAPLKRPPELDQIADFWKRYDQLADIEDQKMSKNLNANLDVLLIFAALFSAINTTFISMTMSSLSPDPLDRTNSLLELLVKRVDNTTLTPSDLTPSFSPQASSIAINFLLYASLCCSLLASMGAMLGKEWLQSFDRSGQTGPLEEQGRLRQRKFNGILQWHLEGTILFLPNLLLFSVTLFFAGLALYLFPINKVIAGLLIAVLSFSVGAWQVTVLAGAIWPLCPYQSAASRAVRSVGLRARRVVMRWKTSFLRVLSLGPSSTATQVTQTRQGEVRNERGANEEQISNAQAAFWLIRTTSSREDRAAAAKFVTTVDKVLDYASVLQSAGNRQSLLHSAQEAFENWYYQPNIDNLKSVETFGRTLSHVDLLRLKNDAKWELQAEGKPGPLHGVWERFLEGLETASRGMNEKVADWELLVYAGSLYALAATGNIYAKSRSWERLFELMGDFKYSLLSRRITYAFWNAVHALRSLPESHLETSAFEIYSTLWQEIRQVATTDRLPDELVSLFTHLVAEFIFDFNESLWANKGSPNLKSDKSLTEALLSLHAILSCDSLPNSSVRDDTQEAFEDRHNQSWSTNLKGFQRVVRAKLSHVGLLHPHNAVKWRFRAEGEPGKLHDALERFLKGFGTASKRMIDKDADWELMTHATSLYGLEATGDTYTKSRSWERLFVLMGDFDFSLLNGRITYAFWKAAHALRSLPESHPETSAFEIYSTFLRDIRDFATPDQLPGELVSLLAYSAVEFIFDFNESFGTNLDSPNREFPAETLLSLRAILPCCSLPPSSIQDRYRELHGRTSWQSPKRTWDPAEGEWWNEGTWSFDNFWRALDSIIAKLAESPPEIKELAVDFFLTTVEWLSISLPSEQNLAGFEGFPQIHTLITKSLEEGNPVRQARGLELLFSNAKRWSSSFLRSLHRVWVEAEEVLKAMVKSPDSFSAGFMGAGFTHAAVGAIQHFDKRRERLHLGWEDLLRRRLGITLELWSGTSPSNLSEWAASDMLLMARHSSVHVEASLNSRGGDTLEVLRFVRLIKHLYERRSLAAFISCNADVAVRSLFCELRRRVEGGTHPHSNAGGDASASPDTDVDDYLRDAYQISQRIDWDYVPYGLPEAPVLCSRPDFVGTQML